MNFRALFEIMKDTLRETLSSKVFYVLLALSAILAIILMLFNFEDASQGGFQQVKVSFIGNELIMVPDMSVKEVQSNVLIVLANQLCGLFGLITAIIITGSFVPRLFQRGTIELYLSRPIRRWEILLGKYIGGLSFVFFQASWLVGLLFVAFGIRSGVWTIDFLWAIPILTFLFAVLYSFSVLMAIMWKQTTPAIFLTIVFWILCGLLGKTRIGIESFITMNEGRERFYSQMAEEGKLPKSMQVQHTQMIQMQNKMRSINEWLLIANTVLPPTTDLDKVANALYTGKGTIEMEQLKVNENINDKTVTKVRPGRRKGMMKKVNVNVAMKRPLLTCLGFIVFCLGLSSVLFYRKEF